MGGRAVLSGAEGANVAAGRGAFYGSLVAVFRHLPDRNLLDKIERGDFSDFFSRCCDLGNGKLDAGLALIGSYGKAIRGRPEEDVLTELSVDRTRILRGTGHRDLKPPYEGLYVQKTGMGDSVLGVRRSYRQAGLLPDETVHESPDFLCVQLDFMKQLCLREQESWLHEKGIRETIGQEKKFLTDHLGRWVGDFCRAVERHAATDFYRGFCLILDSFIQMDRSWLGDVLHKLDTEGVNKGHESH